MKTLEATPVKPGDSVKHVDSGVHSLVLRHTQEGSQRMIVVGAVNRLGKYTEVRYRPEELSMVMPREKQDG